MKNYFRNLPFRQTVESACAQLTCFTVQVDSINQCFTVQVDNIYKCNITMCLCHVTYMSVKQEITHKYIFGQD